MIEFITLAGKGANATILLSLWVILLKFLYENHSITPRKWKKLKWIINPIFILSTILVFYLMARMCMI